MIKPPAALDPVLETAYRSARYEIDCGDGRRLKRHIDQIDAQADAVLRSCGCKRSWSIVTPCNPRSVALDTEHNHLLLLSMRAELTSVGWSYLDAVNRPGPDASNLDWIEPGFCILDQDPTLILALAAHYQQNAVVFAQLGDAPHLIVLD